MTLNLHPECQTRLRESLIENLRHAKVRNGAFLTPAFSLHLYDTSEILPRSGKLFDNMLSFISESPFVDFVYDTLAREIYETQEFQDDDAGVPLDAIAEYADLPALADRLITEFRSLPWQYAITIPLPLEFSNIFCPRIGTMELSDRVSIRTGDTDFSIEYPRLSGIEKRDRSITGSSFLGGLFGATNPLSTWSAKRAYLQISVEGFIGKYATTEPLIEAIEILRTFYGLALALRLFKPSYSHQPDAQREKLFVHQKMGAEWVALDGRDLEERHSSTIRNLKLHDLEGSLDTESKLDAWMRVSLSDISTVLRANDRSKSITLGSQWLFDSYCGNDELLQFVQAAVVVEILLGDKASSDLVGLGELLSNRCAYLIAVSHAQRNDLLQDFRRIYAVRSKIVHQGKSRLASHDRDLFHKLRWLCRRIIQEEVDLLKKDGR